MKYKIIVFGGIALVIVIGILSFVFGGRGTGNEISGTVNVWSFEPLAHWTNVIGAFETENPKVTIIYQQKSLDTYEAGLVNALASDQGPDVFFIHHTWLQKHGNKVFPFPEEVITIEKFKTDFVGVAVVDLVRANRVYALPLYVDTLALYYNKDVFNSERILDPPKTWEQFNEIVEKITRLDQFGDVIRSAAAIGGAGNVNYASDILTALMLQSGTQMVNLTTGKVAFDKQVSVDGVSLKPGQTALEFYTSFADPTKKVYTWNRRLPNSLEAFKRGQTAMYIGYAKDISKIKASAINFAIATLPQVQDSTVNTSYVDLNYANY